ncbi:MAG: hypothetical protein ACLGSA_13370 [Acidobacteriota bacterium]
MTEWLDRLWRYKVPIILYICALVVVQIGPYYYRSDTIRGYLFVEIPSAYDFLRSYELLITVLLFVSGATIPLFGAPSIKAAFGRHLPLNEKGLLTFLKQLDVPVEYKLDRFSQKISKLTDEKEKRKPSSSFVKSLFLDITQPEKQIKTIIESIWGYYSAIDTTNSNFKVVLFFFEEELVQDPMFYYPRHCAPCTPIDILKDPKSAVMVAAKTGHPVIIEDINKSPKEVIFVRQEGDGRTGSIMCFPILINHVNKPKMILSIFTETPGYFRRSNQKIYEFVLKPFKKRLVIEYCLLFLKKTVQTQREEA